MPLNDDNDMTDERLAVRRQRALYRASYRGTREMDFLLGHFAKAHVMGMDSVQLQAFEELMQIPDPVLTGALVDGVGEFEAETALLLERIRRFHKD